MLSGNENWFLGGNREYLLALTVQTAAVADISVAL